MPVDIFSSPIEGGQRIEKTPTPFQAAELGASPVSTPGTRRPDDTDHRANGGSAMNKYTRAVTALAAAAIVIVIAACGAARNSTGAPAERPVSLVERIDVSETTAAKALRQQYLEGAMQGVGAVLERGGSLSIGVFFSHGLHPVELLKTPVPTPAEAAGVSRAEKILPIREAALAALEEALGLAPQRPEVAESLAGMGGESTDVAGSLAGALDEDHGPGDPVVVVISDGEDARFTGRYDDRAGALAALVSPVLPKATASAQIGIFGVGATGGGISTVLNERLVKAWSEACHETGARCLVSPSIEPARLFAVAEGE
jgi:hypothetical protein